MYVSNCGYKKLQKKYEQRFLLLQTYKSNQEHKCNYKEALEQFIYEMSNLRSVCEHTHTVWISNPVMGGKIDKVCLGCGRILSYVHDDSLKKQLESIYYQLNAQRQK